MSCPCSVKPFRYLANVYRSEYLTAVTLRTDFAQGADVKLGDYDNRTALHIAVCEGHPEMVDYLIEQGALIHAKDR